MPLAPTDNPHDAPRYEEFVQLLVAHEASLRAFLRALMPNWADVDEVMQETSLVAWRKFDRFERGSSFIAWAAAIARFEALDYLRRRSREPLVFSPDLVELMATEGANEVESLERERVALDRCLEKLSATQRKLLLLSYRPGARFHEVAEQAGRSIQAYYKTVQRLRSKLLSCIRHEMKEEIA